MAVNNNPLSAISYTNKDFRSLIDELIDLTKKLTEKWDPSITNESDPAMVLLKLDAIIGDKNNYNIDKNILEAFPETLTQDVSARSMYNQLAYHMPWYQSATTEIVCSWKGRDLLPGEIVEIPKFTMLCNEDTSVIYTLLTSAVFNYETLTNRIPAAQGVITDLIINGDNEIHLTNLDSNNRIYFGEQTVAENEVFITNVGQGTYWTQVNNLQVEHEGNTFYEFGVDVRSGNVYIEFPEDIETLIGSGLNIKYLSCDGSNGNVSAQQITKFYEEVSVPIQNSEDNDSVLLSGDSFEIYNPAASVDGADPQSIRDAFKGWKRTAGTYDTLVTLRDYINAIYNTGIVSNDIVSDRLTDIQSAYKIITDRSDYSTSIIKTEEGEMTAYDLKLYLLHNPGIVDNIESYESTFEMELDSSQAKFDVISSVENQKCILHDFGTLKPETMCMFRNLYQLQIKVVPQYYLSPTQVDELKRNIVSNLFDVINSRQMEFGKEPDYYLIYDTILNSDERIKLIVLDDFVYTTYATYLDETTQQFKSIPVSTFNDPYILTGTMEELKEKAKNLRNPQRFLFVEDETKIVYKYKKGDSNTVELEQYSDRMNPFRKQIIAKNILAGVTPLYKQETTFKYTVDQEEVSTDSKDVNRLTTYLNISPFGYEEPPKAKEYEESNKENIATYKLKDNESIQFLGPSFISSDSYSGGCYYEFIMNKPSSSETDVFEASSSKFNPDPNNQDYPGYFTWDGKPIAKSAADTEDKGFITLYYFNPHDRYNFIPIYDSMEEGTNIFETEGAIWRDESKKMSFSVAFEEDRVSFYYIDSVYRVRAGESYRLQKDDKIAFFWRESSDDSSAPYLYHVYCGGSNLSDNIIIKPNFTLDAHPFDKSYINKDFWPSGEGDYTGKVMMGNSGVFIAIQNLPVTNVLSGTKTIDIQGLNQVRYEPDTRGIYFITNNISTVEGEEYYRLTFTLEQYTGTDGNVKYCYQYILGPDEYFICINKSTVSYEMLSYGSMIRLIPKDESQDKNKFDDTKDLLVKTVSYNDIAMNGTNSFYNIALFPDSGTKNYPSGYSLVLREQQVFNFTGGDSIQIEVSNKYEVGKEMPKFETGKWTPVVGFSVRYKSSTSTAYEDLPKIAVSENEDECWRGTALLNVDSSSTDSQAINNNPEGTTDEEIANNRQSIQQFTINGVKYPQNKDGNNDTDGNIDKFLSAIQYLLSSVPITEVGGNNIDISYLNEYGEVKNVDIMVYELNPAFSGKGFDKIGDNILLSIDGQEHTIDNIQLELGYKYIMGIVNNSEDVSFSIKGKKKNGENFNIECITEPELESFSSGSWFFSIDQQDLSDDVEGDEEKRLNSFTITFSPTGESGTNIDQNASLVFEELLKCTDNDFYNDIDGNKVYGISSQDILEEVSSLDLIDDPHGKGKVHGFKYNYKVPDEVLIEDPLKGKYFFNENHVFNQYTIGQAQMRMAGYNDDDSNIVMINNR